MLSHKSPEFLRGRYVELMQRIVTQHGQMRESYDDLVDTLEAVTANTEQMIHLPLSGTGPADEQILVANQRAVEAWKKFQASQATFMITRRQIKELEAAQKLLRQESEVAAQSA